LSGYGVHMVYVQEIQTPADPDWEKVRRDVLRDYQYDASEQLNEKVYQGFRKQYRVNLLFRDSAILKYRLKEKIAADESH
jgi:parvulin-like peptidyl-prolyl isomerase